MKKLTKILSLVLVFAMLTLAFASCMPTDEERVAAAMAKMALAKKADYTVDMAVTVSVGGTTQEVPMTMVMKTDLSDAENPVFYMEMSQKSGNVTTNMITFYKDGYVYVNASGQKFKTQMSYEEMMKDSGSGFDMTEIFEEKKDSVDESFEITKNADGTLHVEMTITKEEFASVFTGFTDQVTGSLGANGTVEVSDTIFQIEIDKENNVTEAKTIMNMELTVNGQKATASCNIKFKYNPVGADFVVPIPTDLSSYINI